MAQFARITHEFFPSPAELLVSGATEGARERVGVLHGAVKADARWHFYSRECTSYKGQSLKIFGVMLNSRLELFKSEIVWNKRGDFVLEQ